MNNKSIVFSEKAPKPVGPYSQAILAGDTLYCSGMLGINPITGKMIDGGVETETKQIFENLYHVLKSAEFNFSNIVKVSIFLKDMNSFKAVNEIYSTYFQSTPPARETIEVSKLPLNGNVEISMIAVR